MQNVKSIPIRNDIKLSWNYNFVVWMAHRSGVEFQFYIYLIFPLFLRVDSVQINFSENMKILTILDLEDIKISVIPQTMQLKE